MPGVRTAVHEPSQVAHARSVGSRRVLLGALPSHREGRRAACQVRGSRAQPLSNDLDELGFAFQG